MPEAYITATRQLVAQTNSWSLEELQLAVEVPSEEDISAVGGLDGLVSGLDKFSFLISGLRLQGTLHLLTLFTPHHSHVDFSLLKIS